MRQDEVNSAFSRIRADESIKARVFDAMEDKEMNKRKSNKIRYLSAVAACIAVTGVTTAFAASPAVSEPAAGIISYMGIIWIAALIVFVIAEAVTYQLITIWFAIGALGALIAEITGAPTSKQAAVFLVLSIVALLLLRPVSKKYLKNKTEKTNVDRLVGMDVLITEDVNNMIGAGKGRVRGMEWTVRSADDREIPAGETAVVKKIEGVKLLVTSSRE